MNILLLDKDAVIKQTVQNMVEAGVIKPEETEDFTKQLKMLDSKDLLVVLLESHNIRERASEPVSFYPIDTEATNKN